MIRRYRARFCKACGATARSFTSLAFVNSDRILSSKQQTAYSGQHSAVSGGLLVFAVYCLLSAVLPVFLGDVFEDGFDGGDGVGAVGFQKRNVAKSAE